MRRGLADWTACALAVSIMALGGLVVIKPAIDNWDAVYRDDPFVVGTTTQKVQKREPAKANRATRTTTTTTEDSSSFVERLLGKSGTLLVRLIGVVLLAFLAAALVQRAILGSYSFRTSAVSAPARAVAREPALNGKPRSAEDGDVPTVPIQNGADTPAEPGVTLAPGIAKLVASRREALGLSQRELAKRAGISHTVVSRIEGGDHSPSPKTLERLAEVLS